MTKTNKIPTVIISLPGTTYLYQLSTGFHKLFYLNDTNNNGNNVVLYVICTKFFWGYFYPLLAALDGMNWWLGVEYFNMGMVG